MSNMIIPPMDLNAIAPTVPSKPEPTEFKSPSLIDMVAQGKAPLTEEGVDLKAMLEAIEVHYLEAALKNANGIVSHAAQKLGLRRTTFIEKMKKHQIVKQAVE